MTVGIGGGPRRRPGAIMGDTMAGGSSKPSEKASEPEHREASAFGEYSSPPCFMHELDPASLGLGAAGDPGASAEGGAPDWPTVRRWRKETRAALIARRMQISAQERETWSARIGRGLEAALAGAPGGLIGFYWPFRGEFDARPVLTALRERGTRLALPVVVEKAQPLQFREWRPGIAMTRGVWDIPIPAEGEAVHPDVLIAPLVGYDPAGYRLGYGGGFYDRTIAAMPVRPRVIGVGFALARLDTIHPQPHDVPMDVIVTEEGAQPRPAPAG